MRGDHAVLVITAVEPLRARFAAFVGARRRQGRAAIERLPGGWA